MKTEEETVSSIEESKLKRTSRYGEEHINGWYKLFISDDTLDHPDQLHDKKAKLSDPFFSADSLIINKTVKWAQRGASAHIEDGGCLSQANNWKVTKEEFLSGHWLLYKALILRVQHYLTHDLWLYNVARSVLVRPPFFFIKLLEPCGSMLHEIAWPSGIMKKRRKKKEKDGWRLL